MDLEICERFTSISGEAPFAGHPVYFIRFSGCNMSCTYCDTKYHSETVEKLSESDLIAIIQKEAIEYPYLKFMFTGGEPLLSNRSEAVLRIVNKLKKISFIVETNGSMHVNDFPDNLVYVFDRKTPSSGYSNLFDYSNVPLMRKTDCIKFVVSSEDMNWSKNEILKIKEINPNPVVYISPQWGNIKFDELSDFIIKEKVPASLSLQIHKIIWDPEQRGV